MFPQKNVFPIDSEPSNRAQMLGDNRWLSQPAFPNAVGVAAAAAAADPPDNIDWAALAQQWIHMKETCHTIAPAPPSLMPVAPPPPRLTQQSSRDLGEEQGEAPMEVEHDDEQLAEPAPSAAATLTAPPPPTNIFGSAKGWSNSHNESGRPSKWNSSSGGKKQNRWNSTGNAGRSKRGNDYHGNQSRAVKVWDTPPPVIANATAASASNETRFGEVDAKSATATPSTPVGIEDGAALDASQRKKLPAWIREGLEKMEREKQRQADRDREMKERDEKRRQEKLLEQNLLMQFNANEPTPLIPAKSKFESDSDTDSDSDDKLNSDKYTSSRTATAPAPAPSTPTVASSGRSEPAARSPLPPPANQHRSKAEIFTEIMLAVRKNLTEILLEVTSEEISAVAQETLSKVRSKGRKPQIVQKIAKTANCTALGLVFYDDSDASRSDYDSDTDRRRGQNDSENDSDLELKKTIQTRKQAFETKAAEIESYLAEKERKEKQWLEEDDTDEQPPGSADQTDAGAATVASVQKPSADNDANKAAAFGTKIERKGSRFSDGKSLIYNLASSQALQNAAVPLVKVPAPAPAPADTKPSDPKHAEAKQADTSSDAASSSSGKKAKKSSRHRGKRDRSRSRSRSKKRKRAGKRSRRSSSDTSSGSDSDAESRHSRKTSGHKHSRRRDRSSSDDRTSRSSFGSHKHDKYSREKSRSHSYRRSRSRSRDRHRRR